MYLWQVKKPDESKARWDYYKLVKTIPAEDAWRPLDQGGCSLVAKKDWWKMSFRSAERTMVEIAIKNNRNSGDPSSGDFRRRGSGGYRHAN